MNLMAQTIGRLSRQLAGRVSRPGETAYNAAITTWAKSIGPKPQAVVHCRTSEDVQAAIRAARDSGVPLSVRGGGHDWAGRALCGGLVIDLRAMNETIVDSDLRSARISGGARTSDVLAVTDPLGLAAVTGACGGIGMAGLTLGGGYGPLTGRFGLTLDNLLAAEVVLADGRIVTAKHDDEPELFWALRGGGGNFGVVTSMQHRLHDLINVRSGMLIFPFAEAKSVLEGYAEIAACAPDELTVQLGIAVGPDRIPVVIVAPTWSGPEAEGEEQIRLLRTIGNALANTVDVMSLGTCLKLFDPFIVGGQRVLIETCWLPVLGSDAINILIQAMAKAVSPGCAILTHEFKGAASRIAPDATAFRLRHDHVLVEILAAFPDHSNALDDLQHQQWIRTTLSRLTPMALPGGYPNLLSGKDQARSAKSFGRNADRLMKAKRQYDPDNIFASAIPLPSR